MKLIENARDFHKFASVRLAALSGIVAAYLAANPDVTQSLLDILPDGPWRSVAAAGIGLFVFATATGTRVLTKK